MDKRRSAVIFDRDGTLASVDWCAPKDRKSASEWKRFNALLPFDPVVPEVAALLHSIRPGVVRIMTSGRARGDYPEDWKRYALARDWLRKNNLPIDHLFMRVGGDFRKDTVVKEEIYRRYIEPHYNVRYAIDDRPEVCDLWESLGIPVLRVKDPCLMPLLLPEVAAVL